MNKQEAIDYIEKELREYFIDQSSIGQVVTAKKVARKTKMIIADMQRQFVFTDQNTGDA